MNLTELSSLMLSRTRYGPVKDCLEVETISNQLSPSCLGEFLCWELSWCGFPHDCPPSARPGRVAGLQCCSAAVLQCCRLCCAGNGKERPDLDRARVLGDLGHQVEKQCRLQHRCCSAATQLTVPPPPFAHNWPFLAFT